MALMARVHRGGDRRWVRKHRRGPVSLVANKTDGLLERDDAQVRRVSRTSVGAVARSEPPRSAIDTHSVARRAGVCCDARDQEVWDALSGDLYTLGIGEATPMSAEHGDGLADLYNVLEPFSRAPPADAGGAVPGGAPTSAVVPAGGVIQRSETLPSATADADAGAETPDVMHTRCRWHEVSHVSDVRARDSQLPWRTL